MKNKSKAIIEEEQNIILVDILELKKLSIKYELDRENAKLINLKNKVDHIRKELQSVNILLEKYEPLPF